MSVFRGVAAGLVLGAVSCSAENPEDLTRSPLTHDKAYVPPAVQASREASLKAYIDSFSETDLSARRARRKLSGLQHGWDALDRSDLGDASNGFYTCNLIGISPSNYSGEIVNYGNYLDAELNYNYGWNDTNLIGSTAEFVYDECCADHDFQIQNKRYKFSTKFTNQGPTPGSEYADMCGLNGYEYMSKVAHYQEYMVGSDPNKEFLCSLYYYGWSYFHIRDISTVCAHRPNHMARYQAFLNTPFVDCTESNVADATEYVRHQPTVENICSTPSTRANDAFWRLSMTSKNGYGSPRADDLYAKSAQGMMFNVSSPANPIGSYHSHFYPGFGDYTLKADTCSYTQRFNQHVRQYTDSEGFERDLRAGSAIVNVTLGHVVNNSIAGTWYNPSYKMWTTVGGANGTATGKVSFNLNGSEPCTETEFTTEYDVHFDFFASDGACEAASTNLWTAGHRAAEAHFTSGSGCDAGWGAYMGNCCYYTESIKTHTRGVLTHVVTTTSTTTTTSSTSTATNTSTTVVPVAAAESDSDSSALRVGSQIAVFLCLVLVNL